jgi:hypothetical protein
MSSEIYTRGGFFTLQDSFVQPSQLVNIIFRDGIHHPLLFASAFCTPYGWFMHCLWLVIAFFRIGVRIKNEYISALFMIGYCTDRDWLLHFPWFVTALFSICSEPSILVIAISRLVIALSVIDYCNFITIIVLSMIGY